MTRRAHISPGLFGQVVAILLLTGLVEFGASVFLYERATEFSARDDEARRLAEHLVISRRLIAEQRVGKRAAMAINLTTDRYAIQWSAANPSLPEHAPALEQMQRQIVAWEPSLASSELRIALASSVRDPVVTGALRLDDGSWVYFRTLGPFRILGLTLGRIVRALVPVIALLMVGGLLLRRLLAPLRNLAVAVDGFGAGADTPRVVETGPSEVRRLVSAFNRLQARIGKLIDERTRALAAVGHDLRTPLARLRLRTDAIAELDLRETIQGDLEEMEAMVASLLTFLAGEGEPEAPTLVDIAVMCASIVDDAIDHGRDVTYAGLAHLERHVRASSFKRAVVNLVENALHFGETVTVTVTAEPGVHLIRVEDDGPGIPEDQLTRVLEPFVRLDTARRRDTVGFGLGLSIVAHAVAAEGGTLRLENRRPRGLCAAILLAAQQ